MHVIKINVSKKEWLMGKLAQICLSDALSLNLDKNEEFKIFTIFDIKFFLETDQYIFDDIIAFLFH